MSARIHQGPKREFPLSPTKTLRVAREESNGFAELRIVDEDGDFMPVTMHELLNAIAAAYYCQKDKKKK